VNELCVCSEPVAQALAARAPVVALETTVVTHGLPHPDGIAAALALEDEVRQSGATPATIGVLRGAIRIGISREELDELATTPDVRKTNLSNLAAVVASGGLGSTTVAATMWAAHINGIRVFATGGIGGVHRGADETGDVSSDLTALGRVPVAVVCAGARQPVVRIGACQVTSEGALLAPRAVHQPRKMRREQLARRGTGDERAKRMGFDELEDDLGAVLGVR